MKKKLSSAKKRTILIVVAHADDETIGMGGTISKHNERGDDVFALSMTDGVSAREDSTRQDADKRREAANLVSKILGFKWLAFGNFHDNQMDSEPLLSIIKFIEQAKSAINPDIIYTHSNSDLNIDHRLTFQATLTAFRPEPSCEYRELRSFEVASSTEYSAGHVSNNFLPNYYVSIEQNWKKKISALKAYKREIKDYPHSRSLEAIENLAKYRGNQVGLKMAEAFQVIRKIER